MNQAAQERFNRVVERAHYLLENAHSANAWGHLQAVQERSKRGFSDEVAQLAIAVAMALEERP